MLPPNDAPVLDAEEVVATAAEDYPQKKENATLSLTFASTVQNQDTVLPNVPHHQTNDLETPAIL